VAVLKGKVAVNGNEAGKMKEAVAPEGNTVIVKRGEAAEFDVSSESLEKKEENVISSISRIEPLKNIGSPTEEDIKNKCDEIDKNLKEPAGETAAKKSGADAGMAGKTKEARIQKLIKEKPKNLEEIKEVFERIDEVSLYSGKVIKGAIISRGENYSILTTGGVVSVPGSQVRSVKVLR
jgi:hypothetical protein